MHGWLDNSNSFTYLGEILAGEGYDVVATDHAGHGHVAQRRGSECDAATPNRRHRVRSLTIAPAVAATT